MLDLRELLTKKKATLGVVEWFGVQSPTIATRCDDTRIAVELSDWKPGEQVLLMGAGDRLDGVQVLEVHPDDKIAASGATAVLNLGAPHEIPVAGSVEVSIARWQKWDVWDVQSLPTHTAIALDDIAAQRKEIESRAEGRKLSAMQLLARSNEIVAVSQTIESLGSMPEHILLTQWLRENQTESRSKIERQQAAELAASLTKEEKTIISKAITDFKKNLVKTDVLVAVLTASEMDVYNRVGRDIESGKKADAIDLNAIEFARLSEAGVLGVDFSVVGEIAEENRDLEKAAALDAEQLRGLAIAEMELLCRMPPGLLSSHSQISRQFQAVLVKLRDQIADLIAAGDKEQDSEKKMPEATTAALSA